MLARLGPMISLSDIITGMRLLWRLPSILRHPISPEGARAILRRRLEHREADFLDMVKRTIYGNVGSPYRRLLLLAGCEYGDLEKLVTQDGVEGALRTLFRHGVYLTGDELKGRRPVVRGTTTLAVDPTQLCNPDATAHISARTSGSRGPATPVGVDLVFVQEMAVNRCLALDARGGLGWHHATWCVPGSTVMGRLLGLRAFGVPPVRWFSHIDPAAPGLHSRYRWSARLMRWGSLLAGVPLPSPMYVPISHPLPIAHWMAEVRRAGGTPHLMTFPSSAVRLCQAAQAAGVDLRGAQLTMSGEPITAARLAEVRRAGMEAVPQYGSVEAGGAIGYGCLAPQVADEIHLYQDVRAVIQPGDDGVKDGLPPTALLLSSIRPTAPLILLNVSLGDQAIFSQRRCGCPLEAIGWTTHLHTIRSYEKLTAGGMTFLDADLTRVLEDVLPARFGGGPTHYQLVEEETADGHPRLRLLAHPVVGPLDAKAVAETFLTAISPGSGVERVMGLLWRDGGFLAVERRAPEGTASGKILHLHVGSRPSSSDWRR